MGVFAFEYRMGDLLFVSRVLVALLDSLRCCLCNDHGLSAPGRSVVRAVSRRPAGDWRKAPTLPAAADA
ncbi:hypothetical protein GXW83_17690 [Streptacidiphilus sp. PB12-B1b]|uniref:hypothetical protein n=1 Tax=Streptacidiphilus sp. PB12-B1b TaxID=2705012 RepID=UPI0015FE5911|nr:hypothetical protein [Streptacidiphilus sp. PB12-B1b]QMU77243.1 hypothetical protein GXW83_17575 [Streptacidiphilus sp. PB12-B1b]QMU77261.1 hypothetical protein GXW83_17690 [Streptacidiphilus sp. PB12-B1b]